MLRVLCIVGFPVQLIRDDFCAVDTHLPGFEALAYVLPHFDKLTHMVIRASTPLSKVLLWIKHGSSLSLENVRDSWRLHRTGLFSSAVVVLQSKFTEFCSSAPVVPESKSTEI